MGHFVLTLPKNSPGLAAVVERVLDVESLDALFGVFEFVKPLSDLIVAWRKNDRIPVNRVMADAILQQLSDVFEKHILQATGHLS